MTDEAGGALFDVDGTLVDTTYLHAVSWWQALRSEGYDVPMAAIHRAIGMGSDRIVDHVLDHPSNNRHEGSNGDRGEAPHGNRDGDSHGNRGEAPHGNRDGEHGDRDGDSEHGDEHGALVERLSAAHTALYSVYWERLRPTPGAAELLRAFAARGRRVVLASSASARELAMLRRAIGADDVIATATSASDVEASKPAPDIFAVALERSGLSADRTVVVGDSVWDVRAADRIGLPCIGVTCGGVSESELRGAGACEVYSDPAELLSMLDKSIIIERSRQDRG